MKVIHQTDNVIRYDLKHQIVFVTNGYIKNKNSGRGGIVLFEAMEGFKHSDIEVNTIKRRSLI
jgi:hypothetical protein